MKGRLIALDEIGGRRAAALMEDGVLQDFLIEPETESGPVPGAIYRAITERPMKGQGGIFLGLGEGRGYLRQAKGIAPGEAMLVQVSGWAEPGKAAPVSPKVLFKSRFAIVTPGAPGINVSRAIRDEERRDELLSIAHDVLDGAETGLILRSAAETGDDAEIAEDIAEMAALAAAVTADAKGRQPELLLDGPDPHLLAWRDWSAPDLLDKEPGSFERHGVDAALDVLFDMRQPLPGGGHVFLEPTRALVAVDVNTGGDTSPAAGLKANIAAARALPRLLRCRGLAGQVVLDLAPMPKKDRKVFEQSLRAALRADGGETVMAGWTPLGNFELQRKRERLPVSL